MRYLPAASIRRSFTILSATALATTALVVVAGTANAVVTAGGGRSDDRTPVFVRDREGLAVQMCTNAVNCEPTDTTEGDIGTYFAAGAVAGPLRAEWSIDAAFLENAAGGISNRPAVSNSARFRADGLRPNRRYTIRGPWGAHRCFSDNRGRLDCAFARGGEAGGRLRSGPVKSLLRARVAPRGFVGALEIPQRVAGSPSGFNRVTLRGPGARASTRLFSLTGQLAANTPMSSVSKDSLRMGNRNNHRRIVRVLRYRSIGTAPARFRVRRGGQNPVAFKVRENCRAVAPGRVCKIRVIYRPTVHDKRAFLTIRDNTMAQPRRVSLRAVAPARRR